MESKRDYTKESLIKAMRNDVAAYNKQWSKELISEFSHHDLFARCHPSYRDEYRQWYEKLYGEWLV